METAPAAGVNVHAHGALCPCFVICCYFQHHHHPRPPRGEIPPRSPFHPTHLLGSLGPSSSAPCQHRPCVPRSPGPPQRSAVHGIGGWGVGVGGSRVTDAAHRDEFALERVVLAGFSSRFCDEGSDGRECLSLVTGALGPGTQTSQAREPAVSTAQPSPLPLQACGAACGSFSLISPTL